MSSAQKGLFGTQKKAGDRSPFQEPLRQPTSEIQSIRFGQVSHTKLKKGIPKLRNIQALVECIGVIAAFKAGSPMNMRDD